MCRLITKVARNGPCFYICHTYSFIFVKFDALIGKLTGREMLRMYAQLRGVPSDMINAVVASAVNNLSLSEWADKMCGNYRSVYYIL